jgi:hypothetical protein
VLAGASSKILRVDCRATPYVSEREVNIKIIAVALVSFVNRLPAPEVPKSVWLEPPNTAPTSAPLPCCNKTTETRNIQDRT